MVKNFNGYTNAAATELPPHTGWVRIYSHAVPHAVPYYMTNRCAAELVDPPMDVRINASDWTGEYQLMGERNNGYPAYQRTSGNRATDICML